MEDATYGTDGKLTLLEGKARVVWEYDAAGNQQSETWYGAGGNALMVLRFAYDHRGLPTTKTAERDGEPVAIPNRAGMIMYEVRYRYDPWGRMTHQLYFGKGETPIGGHCPAWHISYDASDKSTGKCGPHPD